MIPGTHPRDLNAAFIAKLSTRSDRCDAGWAENQHPQFHACDYFGGSEWTTFTRVLRESVRGDGTIHQADVRPRLRGRIEPKHIGLCWKRAKRDGLVVEAGFERSNDEEGKNAHRMEAFYELTGGASERNAA